MGLHFGPLAGPPARGTGKGTLTPALRARAAAIRQSGDIALYGIIGDSWDGLDVATVIAQIEDMGDVPRLTIRVNSPGGYVTEGLALFNYLKDHPAHVSVVVDSLSASIASLITMAGDEIVMQRGALMMIHNPWNIAIGDADELRSAADVLDKMGTSMAAIYAERSGKSVDAVQALMDAETWYTAAEAVEAGFATRAAAQDADLQAAACFDLSGFKSVPTVLATARATYTHALKDQKMEDDELGAGAGTLAGTTAAATTTAPQQQRAANTSAPQGAGQAGASASAEAMAQARRLVSDISAACRRHDLPRASIDTITATADDLPQANAMILDALAARDSQTNTRSGVQVGISHDNPDAVRTGIVGALAHSMDRSMVLEGRAQQYRGYSPLALFEEWSQANGRPVQRRTRDALAQAALHSTSDFPLLLGDAANQVLMASYQQAAPSYRTIATQRGFNDFRPHNFLRVGDFPELLPLSESGEIKAGTLSESKESASLTTYARKISITRQTLVNDTLGAFSDFPGLVARRIAAQENALAYAVLTANAGAGKKMSDGKALFHTDHSNIAAAAAALSVDSLSDGRAVMRKQKTVDGLKLNPTAKILLVSPDNETTAQQLTTVIAANTTTAVNPFQGTLQVVSDAELEGTGWYLFGDPGLFPILIFGYLDGQEGPALSMKEGWDTDGAEMRVVHDFGVGATGTIGGYFNAGA